MSRTNCAPRLPCCCWRRCVCRPARCARRIIQDLTALGSLVNQLLRFAQAEDVMMRERGLVDLTAAVQRVCEDLAGTAIGRGVHVRVRCAGRAGDRAGPRRPDRHRGAQRARQRDPLVTGEYDGLHQRAGVAARSSSRIAGPACRTRRRSGFSSGSGAPLPTQDRRARHRTGAGAARDATAWRDARVEDRPGGGARFILVFAPPAPPHLEGARIQGRAGATQSG